MARTAAGGGLFLLSDATTKPFQLVEAVASVSPQLVYEFETPGSLAEIGTGGGLIQENFVKDEIGLDPSGKSGL